MTAMPVSIMPRTSASEFIVVAVPIVLQKPGDGAAEPASTAEVDVHIDRARLLSLGDRLDHLGDRGCLVPQSLTEPPAETTGWQHPAPPLRRQCVIGRAATEQVTQQPITHGPLLQVVELDRQAVGHLVALVEQ